MLETITTSAAVAAAAIVAGIRRAVRIMHAVMAVTMRHVHPRVAAALSVILPLCLFFPGPFDELIVLLVIAVYASFKPAMRAELASAIRTN